ncbi:carnitine/acyl carnitine carrier [Coprinopsis cinerea AmutBmut pab1-1]|nr:carnitine/acyl carnitine carrier [Coprinopsis cinerea AmutBmut pab1-1]
MDLRRNASLFLLYAFCGLLASAWAHTLPALIDSRDELSVFGEIVRRFPALVGNLTAAGGTVFAPTNDAIRDFLIREAGGSPAVDALSEDIVNDLLSYHILPLSLRSDDLGIPGGVVVETSLLDEQLANLEGTPNVVFASAFGSTGQLVERGRLSIFSGVGEPAAVSVPDLEIEGGGILHIIDNVLNFPRTCTDTAEVASLSTLQAALETTNLTTVVDTTPKFTCFAPTDEAFAAAGIDLTQLSTKEIEDALKYHSIVGDVGYSTAFEDGQEYQTLLGVPVTVSKRDGNLYINDVAVEQANVIMTNGVAHVLSGVLVPPAGAVPSDTGSDGSGDGEGGGSGSGSDDDPNDTDGSGVSRTGVDLVASSALAILTYLMI